MYLKPSLRVGPKPNRLREQTRLSSVNSTAVAVAAYTGKIYRNAAAAALANNVSNELKKPQI